MPAIREVFPYLIVQDAARAIEFYRQVFGAEERLRMPDPDKGRIGHAALALGPATIMLADEYPELGIRSPTAFGGTGLRMHLHVDDVDALYEHLKSVVEDFVNVPTTMPWGNRALLFRDPDGNMVNFFTPVTPEAIEKFGRRTRG